MWDTVSRERNEGSSLNQAAASFYSLGLKKLRASVRCLFCHTSKWEVVSGRVPGGAYIANHLALLDLLACHHTDGGTVGIQGFVGVVVAHFDVVPVPAAPGVYPLAMVTVPSAAARMGVPPGAPMSVPLW